MAKNKGETVNSRIFGIEEPICDEDGLYEGCLTPPEQARILYWLSWFGLLSGAIGIYKGYRWLGLSVCIGAVFAQLFWARPTYSWRRILDIVWVQVIIWSHMWFAVGSPVFFLYCCIQILGAAAYALSWYLITIGETWASTLAHAIMHCCANGSMLVLYLS